MDPIDSPLDLVIAGGRVLDPGQGLDGALEVGIRGSRIAAVAPALPRAPGTHVLDAGGRLVLPGLIDLHAHLFHGISALGVDPDTTCLPNGVTTAVDAGTAGHIGLEAFRRRWMEPAATRVRAFVNLSSLGLVEDDGFELGERELRHVDLDRLVGVLRDHADVCLGVKVRLATNQTAPPRLDRPLTLALEATERTGTRLMVHITEPGLPLDSIFDRLRPGDIVTHLFHGRAETIVGADGRVLASAKRARARGVRMDIGHGGGSFTYRTARAALADGFEPDTISTDLHAFSLVGAMKDLPTTMAKFLALGMPLERVVAAVTVNAARAIEQPDVTGTLAVGDPADVAILEEIRGPVTLADVTGEQLQADRSLRAWRTVRAGTVVAGDSTAPV